MLALNSAFTIRCALFDTPSKFPPRCCLIHVEATVPVLMHAGLSMHLSEAQRLSGRQGRLPGNSARRCPERRMTTDQMAIQAIQVIETDGASLHSLCSHSFPLEKATEAVVRDIGNPDGKTKATPLLVVI